MRSGQSLQSTVLLVIIYSLTPNAVSQSTAQKVRPASPDSIPISIPRDEQAAQQRTSAILRLRGFVNRALEFRDVEAKAYTLTALADTLWKYDEASARELFLQTFNFLKSIKLSEAAKESSAEAKLTAGKFADLRDNLISTLARHDASLARRFSDSGSDTMTDAERALTAQRTAMNLLVGGDSGNAVEFAERSLSGGVPKQMVGFLLQLRRRDERQADELYLQTLNRLLTEPHVDGTRLMELGVYVFTSPFIDPAMEEKGAMVIQSVGGVGVVNLSVVGLISTHASRQERKSPYQM